jgi:hypothetical protein
MIISLITVYYHLVKGTEDTLRSVNSEGVGIFNSDDVLSNNCVIGNIVVGFENKKVDAIYFFYVSVNNLSKSTRLYNCKVFSKQLFRFIITPLSHFFMLIISAMRSLIFLKLIIMRLLILNRLLGLSPRKLMCIVYPLSWSK